MSDMDNRSSGRRDPTKMVNQPALRQSRGTIWIVMGGLFLIVVLIPFAGLAFAGSGRSAPLAMTIGVGLIVLYVALLVARVTISRRKLRLQVMAACMLTMAAVGLIGIWACAVIEGSIG
ncbi:hypothetical protein [Leucobacter sp. GX24907]